MARQEFRIVVEGMDGAGKSVLISNLIDRINNMELIVNEKGPEQDFSVWWPQQLDMPEGPIVPIHDRFFYSELVYGPTLRGRVAASDILINNVLWFLRSTSLLIYARPHTERLRQGASTNPQMEGVSDRFTQLVELYDQIMEQEMGWFGPRFIHYVWHRDGELDRVEQITRSYLAGELR